MDLSDLFLESLINERILSEKLLLFNLISDILIFNPFLTDN